MKRIVVGLLIAGLVLGGLALPAEAGGWKHRRHGHHGHFRAHGHGHFLEGLLIGIGTGVLLDVILTPRVYYPPVCHEVWVPGRWVVRYRRGYGYAGYHRYRVGGHWEKRCY